MILLFYNITFLLQDHLLSLFVNWFYLLRLTKSLHLLGFTYFVRIFIVSVQVGYSIIRSFDWFEGEERGLGEFQCFAPVHGPWQGRARIQRQDTMP